MTQITKALFSVQTRAMQNIGRLEELEIDPMA